MQPCWCATRHIGQSLTNFAIANFYSTIFFAPPKHHPTSFMSKNSTTPTTKHLLLVSQWLEKQADDQRLRNWLVTIILSLELSTCELGFTSDESAAKASAATIVQIVRYLQNMKKPNVLPSRLASMLHNDFTSQLCDANPDTQRAFSVLETNCLPHRSIATPKTERSGSSWTTLGSMIDRRTQPTLSSLQCKGHPLARVSRRLHQPVPPLETLLSDPQ